MLAALRAKKGDKKLNMTRDVDPTAPATFPEHGGALWFKGKGPARHAMDPARAAAASRPKREATTSGSPRFPTSPPAHASPKPSNCWRSTRPARRSSPAAPISIPSLRQHLFAPRFLVDIRGIGELRGIRAHDGGLEIGALTTLTAIERSPEIARNYPVLHEAAKTVASPMLRNMGTIGGNICLDTRCLWYNQSLQWRKSCGFCIKKDGDLCHVAPGGTKCWAAFSGDTPPALLCLEAEIEIAGPKGTRRVPLSEFYTNVGDARMKLEKNELLTRVLLPAKTPAGAAFIASCGYAARLIIRSPAWPSR